MRDFYTENIGTVEWPKKFYNLNFKLLDATQLKQKRQMIYHFSHMRTVGNHCLFYRLFNGHRFKKLLITSHSPPLLSAQLDLLRDLPHKWMNKHCLLLFTYSLISNLQKIVRYFQTKNISKKLMRLQNVSQNRILSKIRIPYK